MNLRPNARLRIARKLIYVIHVTCKTCSCLKSHHKWACWRLRATQLLVIPPKVLHRKGPKRPMKPIRGPYTNCPALSQEQSTIPSRHFCRQTTLPKGGPETTGVIDNVSKTKHAPPPSFLWFFVCFFFGGRGKREVPKLSKLTYLPASRLYDD
jgi:hypothetical protein